MAKAKRNDASLTIEQRKRDRRSAGLDRRTNSGPVPVERRLGERREKVNRRRQIDPTTCERDYTPDEVEFMHALEVYKRKSGRMFPTCSEVLEVLRGLGYEKHPSLSASTTSEPSCDASSVQQPTDA